MKTMPHNQFKDYMLKIQESFMPNNEISPTRDENIPLEKADVIDLNKQEPGTIIFLRGLHRGADYRIRTDNGYVEVWRDMDKNGLRGPLESIVSWQGSPEGIKVEEGVIRKESYSLMPYFSYDKSKSPKESVLKPKDAWGGAYLLIFIQKPRK